MSGIYYQVCEFCTPKPCLHKAFYLDPNPDQTNPGLCKHTKIRIANHLQRWVELGLQSGLRSEERA